MRKREMFSLKHVGQFSFCMFILHVGQGLCAFHFLGVKTQCIKEIQVYVFIFGQLLFKLGNSQIAFSEQTINHYILHAMASAEM